MLETAGQCDRAWWGLGLSLWLGALSASGQEAPRIREGSVRLDGAGGVRFQFEMTTGDARAFRIESLDSLSPGVCGQWTRVP